MGDLIICSGADEASAAHIHWQVSATPSLTRIKFGQTEMPVLPARRVRRPDSTQ